MEKLSMNLVVILMIIHCKEIAGDLINLKYFREAIIFSEQDLGVCGFGCGKQILSETANYKSTFTKQVCDGYLVNCQTIVGKANTSLQFCLDDQNSRMVWAENKQYGGAQYGIQPRECITPINEPLKTKNSETCEACVCTCYHERESSEDENVWKFSLAEETSGDAKVVTGLRFTLIDNIIHLQIKENDLISTTNGTWKSITVDSDRDGPDTRKYATLSHELQTIKLNQIFSPENSVITGVKFVKVPNLDKRGFALELKIRSTKLNDENDALDPRHQDWHSGDPSTLTAGPRWWPDRGIHNTPLPIVSLNRTSLNKDFGMTTNPQFYADPVVSCAQHDYPLKGIQLLLVELGGQEVIIPRISPAIIKGSTLPDYLDYESNSEPELTDSANTANLQFCLIAMLPLLIIWNLFN